MARLPLVAVVGRPNVGKSTLFNRIVGKRISIVNDEPGVTRDRIYADGEWCGRNFTLIDTGGIELKSDDKFSKHILAQADIAINMADLIVFIVDGKEGLTSSDLDVAARLRKTSKPVLLVVNKLDNYREEDLYEFYSLGLGDPIGISAEQATGLGDLLDKIVEALPENSKEPTDEGIKVAIVGKPNAGKSSIINRLLGENRVIVSDVAGTTRDAVDIPFNYNKQKYTLIDTAGLRRKSKIEDETTERYSVFRTIDSIRRADVVVLVIDANEPISEQDVRIAGLIHEELKPSVVVMNKWDLIDKDTTTINKFEKQLATDLAYMDYFKSVYLSALTGKRIEKLMQTVEEVWKNANKKITAGTLNDILQNAYAISSPSGKGGKKLKIFYATQTGTTPPTFVLFVNDTTLMADNYKRYLENSIREAVDFSGTPIRITLKAKDERDIF
ncbi:MAG: ribosome biogenesis GTPase Der [Clostridia bacterium]|nr:ribosome biogenesis GTPase Der [Clostridia bacterium]